jgi:hypothetical protein
MNECVTIQNASLISIDNVPRLFWILLGVSLMIIAINKMIYLILAYQSRTNHDQKG